MANGADTELTAPYLPYSTFRGFIRDLKASVVPTRIDRTIMKHMSGGDQSSLRTALRFFEFVTGDDFLVTPEFKLVVSTFDTPEWKGMVVKMFARFNTILNGLDLKTTTPGLLEEAFRERGNVDGSALKKAVRFFQQMAEDAGVELSPLLKGRKTTGGSPRAPTPRKARRAAPTNHDEDDGGGDVTKQPPAGVKLVRFPLPERDVRMWLPDDLSDAELAFVWKYLKDYMKLRQGSKSK